jgi:hypothetical protein
MLVPLPRTRSVALAASFELRARYWRLGMAPRRRQMKGICSDAFSALLLQSTLCYQQRVTSHKISLGDAELGTAGRCRYKQDGRWKSITFCQMNDNTIYKR